MCRWRYGNGILAVLLVGSCVEAAESAGANALNPAEVSEGWLLLFDGQTLFGWEPSPAVAWQVAEGMLLGQAGQSAGTAKPSSSQKEAPQAPTAKVKQPADAPLSGAEPPARLSSSTEWADFVLRMEFRTALGARASLWLRSAAGPEGAAGDKKSGYQVVLASDDPAGWPVGSLRGRKKAATGPEGPGWHSLEATVQAGTIQLRLDDQEVLRYEDPEPIRRGHLVLEVENGSAAFRNIKLRPLGLRSIFNGKDLAGWKLDSQSATKATVSPEGYLRIQGGRGYLESEGAYADFVLQLEVFVNGRGLNSGVFFRCIPGESMNGYECQIHNGFLDGDRSKPKDCGTGGIFRRQNARRVVADDFQWFTLTIHADGPHIATWVNGYQTADWTDTRAADANPRKGRRLEAGALQIQGHDPTTDLMFRNIRIGELPR